MYSGCNRLIVNNTFTVISSGVKKQGVVRHIGLSSHTPGLVIKVLDAGIVDELMFSINPGYDYRHGDYANGSTEERMAMYRKCEADGGESPDETLFRRAAAGR